MTTVGEEIDLPGSGTPTGIVVTIGLHRDGGQPVTTWVTANGHTVHGQLKPTLASGVWTADLVPNASMTPTGTRYKRTIDRGGFASRSDYFEVPTSGTFTSLLTLLSEAPASVASPALSLHLANPTDAHDASAVSIVDAGDYFDAVNVEAALQEIGAGGIGGGGGGGVSDGDKGDVEVSGSGTVWAVPGLATLAAAITTAVGLEATAREQGDAANIPLSQKAAANGVATLGADGKIPSVQFPPLVIGETTEVNSEAAMLALDAQRGDVAVRTDLDPDGVFILLADTPTVLAAWRQITAPGAVISVDGRAGAVSLTDLYQPLDGDLTALAGAGNSGILAITTAAFLTADETKLDGIEAGADVTDAANVAAAGAVMTTGAQSKAGDLTLTDDLIAERIGAGADPGTSLVLATAPDLSTPPLFAQQLIVPGTDQAAGSLYQAPSATWGRGANALYGTDFIVTAAYAAPGGVLLNNLIRFHTNLFHTGTTTNFHVGFGLNGTYDGETPPTYGFWLQNKMDAISQIITQEVANSHYFLICNDATAALKFGVASTGAVTSVNDITARSGLSAQTVIGDMAGLGAGVTLGTTGIGTAFFYRSAAKEISTNRWKFVAADVNQVPLVAQANSAGQVGDLIHARASGPDTLVFKVDNAGGTMSLSDGYFRTGVGSQVFVGDYSGFAAIRLGSAGDTYILRTAAAEVFTNRTIFRANAVGQVPFVAQQFNGSQTGNLSEWQATGSNGAGTIFLRVDKDGYLVNRKVAAPADGSLAASELAPWFTDTNGAAVANWKGKTANGTVVTGSLPMDGSAGITTTTGDARYAPKTRTVGTALATTGTIDLDMAALHGTIQTITLSGNPTFTTSNKAAGRELTLVLAAGGSSRTLTWPSWTPLGAALPTTLASGKTAVLTLTFTGTTEASGLAAYVAQP